MLDLEYDMATVFFGSDFATPFTRLRPHAADVEVVGILGVTDDDALEGRAMVGTRLLRMPATADVRADDVLVAAQAVAGMGVVLGAQFRVLDPPRRTTDGMEIEALLGSVLA